MANEDDEPSALCEDEQFYDTEVAPALLELSRKCKDRGMSFVASVGWRDGDYPASGSTVSLPDNPSAQEVMTVYAARTKGNFDAFMGLMLEHSRKHGHSSVYIQMIEGIINPSARK